MGARINTIMQTCFFAHLRRAAARRGHRPHQEGHQEDLRPQGDGGRAEELRGGGRRPWRNLHEVKVPGKQATGEPRPPVVAEAAPDFVKRVTAAHPGRQGRRAAGLRLPGGRHLAHRHHASGRSATSRWRSRSGTRRSASSATSARSSARTPPSGPSSTRPSCAGKAPRPASSRWTSSRADVKGAKYTVQVAPEDCTGCGAVRGDLPGRVQDGEAAQGAINMEPTALPLKREGAGQLRLLPVPPRARPDQGEAGRQGHAVPRSRSSSSPAPAPAAARPRT